MTIKNEDDGSGMPEEARNHIFEAFYTTKERGVGTGLGLGVTKKIVEEDHKDVILCDSEVGLGTTFTIELPEK